MLECNKAILGTRVGVAIGLRAIEGH